MLPVDSTEVEYALSKISDGDLFEKFAQEFLSAYMGADFNPIGGFKDKGVDGLERIFLKNGLESTYYQLSIEERYKEKILSSVKKLLENSKKVSRFVYVTNQRIKDVDEITEEVFETYNVPIQIWDSLYLSLRMSHSQATLVTYHTFVDSHFHKFSKPAENFVVSDFVSDPRLYIFLRHQIETTRSKASLDDFLADTLILFALEGTDPDKGKAKSKEEIYREITNIIKFDASKLLKKLDDRITQLSEKPRKIKFDSRFSGYVLPFETRQELMTRKLRDAHLHDTFKRETENRLRNYLKDEEIRVNDCEIIIEKTFNQIFFQQGLEFSQLILNGQSTESFEKNLPEIISRVVEESSIVPKNRGKAKQALLFAVRDIAYNGTVDEKLFLAALSQTYTILFLLQCEPKINSFFSITASQLEVYVCASVIIPALSEFFLDQANKRYWALLKGAASAGVTLVVNESIVSELVNHFESIRGKYINDYFSEEDFLSESDIASLYVPEILLRSYFYARSRNRIKDFNSFLDHFVDPSFRTLKEDLIDFLSEEFRIKFIPDKNRGILLDENEKKSLSENLEKVKKHKDIAEHHAVIALTVYSLRQMNNEVGQQGIFGYKTWWLSQDKRTYEGVRAVLAEKYPMSCYMRPDFLFNYVALAPTADNVNSIFKDMFPTLLGVNISFHIAPEIIGFTQQWLADHKEKTPGRVKSVLRNLGEKLKSDPEFGDLKKVKLFLDEELEEIHRLSQQYS